MGAFPSFDRYDDDYQDDEDDGTEGWETSSLIRFCTAPCLKRTTFRTMVPYTFDANS